VQQLHDRPEPQDEPDVMTSVRGPRPTARAAEVDGFVPRVLRRGGTCLVVNDEAHHTHDEGLRWNEIIRDLHAALAEGGGGVAQLDMSATPRYGKGGELFTWTVFDYPLRQAIVDGIVKRPIKGVTSGAPEVQSDIASVRYQVYLAAGVERWREYRDQLAPLGRKPVLFVMMNEAGDADDVGDFLRTKYPAEFAGDRLLVIHTNRSGDVAKGDEDLQLDEFTLGKDKLVVTTVHPDPAKAGKDIDLPRLSPILVRKKSLGARSPRSACGRSGVSRSR